MSTPRASPSPTLDSVPVPDRRRYRASRFARASSSAYDSSTAPHRTATACGDRAAQVATRVGTDCQAAGVDGRPDRGAEALG
ncbi:hypothetical protein [Streptomyces pseudovenezuelae]|uniref:hypothetical protein n=1 Tax=Streptomyces pseudovenezuelae TaxID=67350 RepID=UPI0024772B9F|nr:hypothetical protein [Streptomyces pseudovenezuelae]